MALRSTGSLCGLLRVMKRTTERPMNSSPLFIDASRRAGAVSGVSHFPSQPRARDFFGNHLPDLRRGDRDSPNVVKSELTANRGDLAACDPLCWN
jgi:hypothetical protein